MFTGPPFEREISKHFYLSYFHALHTGDNHEHCESPQYLELGTRGKINCSVREQFYVLSWYNSTDYDKEYPVIFISDNLKEGVGFVSGEYDIDSDGSLIINEVLLKHEGTFTLLLLFLERDEPVINKIHVTVTGKDKNY